MLKKAHKILCSRYLWAVFVIVLEFAQLLAVFTLLFEYFLPITVMGIVFHVGVLLYVINKDEIPEFKIPWLIILFFLPVIGAFIYMLFTSTGQSRKDYQKFQDAHRRLRPYTEQLETIREELKRADVDAWSLCRNGIIRKWKQRGFPASHAISSSRSCHESIITAIIEKSR